MWLGIGDAGYTVEAKVIWPSTNWNLAVRNARAELDAAGKQLNEIEDTFRCGAHIALCYVVPEFPIERVEGQRQFFSRVAARLKSKLGLLATYRRLAEVPEYKGYRYPGVLIVGEVVSWQ